MQIQELESTQIALVLCLEANKLNSTVSRWYELEALKCIDAWRQRGGWLSQIHCYAVEERISPINLATRRALLRKSNVEILSIEDGCGITRRCKLLKKVLAQLSAAREARERYLVNIDLDMTLQSEIPRSFFSNLRGKAIVPRYTEIPESRQPVGSSSYAACSFFIAWDKQAVQLPQKVLEAVQSLEFVEWFEQLHLPAYYLEEAAYDFLAKSSAQFQECMLRVESAELDTKYFDHEHISPSEALTTMRRAKEEVKPC